MIPAHLIPLANAAAAMQLSTDRVLELEHVRKEKYRTRIRGKLRDRWGVYAKDVADFTCISQSYLRDPFGLLKKREDALEQASDLVSQMIAECNAYQETIGKMGEQNQLLREECGEMLLRSKEESEALRKALDATHARNAALRDESDRLSRDNAAMISQIERAEQYAQTTKNLCLALGFACVVLAVLSW